MPNSLSGAILLISALFLLPGPTSGQDEIPIPSEAPLIDEVVTRYAEYRNFHGAVLVAKGDDVIFEKAFGYGNLEWSQSSTLATRYRIASITKCFTAVLVMQQVERGKLRLEGKVTDYLPGYHQETGDQITIHHLLSHTSGLIDYPDVPEDFDIRERLHHNHSQLRAYFEDRDLLFPAGEQFRYSNFGYVLLAIILEQVTGRSYSQLLQEEIFAPAGMHSTGIDDNETLVPERAAGYHHRFLGQPVNAAPLDMSVVLGSGNIYSTVGDLYRFDRALYAGKLILQSNLEVMSTPIQNPNMQFYGYGLDIQKREWGPDGEPVTVVGLAGSINGFRSNYSHFLEDDICVVVITNYKDLTGSTIEVASPPQLVENIVAIMCGRQPQLPRPSAASVIGKRVLAEGGAVARTALTACKTAKPELSIESSEFRDLAFWFQGRSLANHALEIMRAYCSEMEPSPLDLARLAAFYHLNGRNEEAETALARALAENQWEDALINMIGYEFLGRGLYREAIFLFSRNVEKFSDSANAFDSLGEAFLKAGKLESARDNYRRSLELNPDNANAEAMLKFLDDQDRLPE